MTAYATKFYAQAREVNVWDCHQQQWTGRTSAALVFQNDQLMATLSAAERVRIARLAAWRGLKSAGSYWAANATSTADRIEARKFAG